MVVSALLLQFGVQAQRACGTTEHMHQLMEQNPGFEQNLQDIENFTQEWIAHHEGEDRVLVTIPVVVHVVWNTTSENISDAQVISQINVLNEDFRKLNADWTGTPGVFQPLVADANIEFCLASVDPNGAATTGIVRRQTSTTSFSSNNNVKFTSSGGDDAWPSSSYLNMWVCDLGSGLLGYAQFPGGPASTDGVVIDYQAFGNIGTAAAPFNKGRSATHEVGHWLNLYHIWGDDGSGCTGSDLVSDTPNQGPYNFGCPSFPHVSCGNSPNGDLFMNYMDYTDDACMFMFSNGQSSRMSALFGTGGARASLLTSNGCGTPGTACNTPTGQATTAITASGATFNWSAASGAVSYNVRYKLTTSSTWINTTSSITSSSVTGLAACSTYEWQVQTVCSSGTSAYSASTGFSTTGCTSNCNSNYEENDVSSQATPISTNTNYYSYICPAYDDDWFSASNTSSQKNLKVTLTSLPADYDIFLYNPSGTLVGVSENGGTTNETIIYNNGPVGTYKVKVIGYNGATHNTDSYILKVNRRVSPYRLDGTDDESESTIQTLNAFPNPSNDKVNIVFNSVEETEVVLRMFDMLGRELVTRKFVAEEGENTTAVNLSEYAIGCFTVILSNDKSSATVRVCKE